MKEIKLKVGNDTGNSEHDVMINGHLIAQPNVMARVNKIPNLDELSRDNFIKDIQNNLIVNICNDGVRAGNYFVGNFALKSNVKAKSIDVSIDNDKVKSEIVMVNTLAQIAGEAVREAYLSNSLEDELTVNVDMTGSIPVKYYSKKAAKEYVDRYMDKKHIVNVSLPEGSVLVKIIFEYIKIIPEGVTAIHYLKDAPDSVFDTYNKKLMTKKDNGEITGSDAKKLTLNKDFFADKSKKILHISIGEGTTEYPITFEKIKYDRTSMDGSNNGVGVAITDMITDYKKETRNVKATRQDISNAFKDPLNKWHDVACELLEIPLENQSDEILEIAKEKIDNNDVDCVVVYGGGSIAMRDALEKPLQRVCDERRTILLYVDEKDAVTLEVKGLFNLVDGKLFEKLKERNLESEEQEEK